MIVGVVQARAASRRLPGKVLADLLGAPMLARQLERLGRARRLDRLVVATTGEPEDDAVAQAAREAGAEVHRGSVDDVLTRVLEAAGAAEHVVRLTADCPLACPELVDRVVELHLSGAYDYTSNVHPRRFPDGLDVEVATFEALARAAREARRASEREHVTPFLWSRPERFRLGALVGERDLAHLRWTVDEPADLEFVRAVYGALHPLRPDFTTAEVLALVERRPELALVNRGIATNEGYARSLEEDRG